MSAVTCPGCGAAAEITEHFTLASTDGLVPPAARRPPSVRIGRDRDLATVLPW